MKIRYIAIAVLLLLLVSGVAAVAISDMNSREEHSVEVTVVGQGTVSPSSATVDDGGSVELTITPADGWTLSYAAVDGAEAEVRDGILRIEDVRSDTEVRVVFVQQASASHSLTVASGTGGSVTPSGTASYEAGRTVSVSATPDDGYVVSDISVDGVSMGAINVVSVTMDSDHSVAVAFREASSSGTVDPTVTIGVDVVVRTTGAEWGTVEPSGAVRVAYGGSLVVTVTLNDGYELASISVGGSAVAAEPQFTVSDITGSVEVLITVTGPTVHVTSSASSGGSISPSGTTPVLVGGSLTFTMTPDAGYRLSSLTVDGVSVGSASSYTLTDIRADAVVHATFARSSSPTPGTTYYTVTVSAGAGGTVSGAGSRTFESGTSYSVSGSVLTIGGTSFTASADTGYGFEAWTSSGSAVASGTIMSDKMFTATFAAVPTQTTIALSSTTLALGSGVDGGESATLTATVTPSVQNPSIAWTSSDESVATVDQGGRVTAAGGRVTGTATITAVCDGASATCVVTVSPMDVLSVTVDGAPISTASVTVAGLAPGVSSEVVLKITAEADGVRPYLILKGPSSDPDGILDYITVSWRGTNASGSMSVSTSTDSTIDLNTTLSSDGSESVTVTFTLDRDAPQTLMGSSFVFTIGAASYGGSS